MKLSCMSDCNGKPTAVMACAWREDLQWKARPVSQAMCEGRGMPNEFNIINSPKANSQKLTANSVNFYLCPVVNKRELRLSHSL
jgi:hypothetical protein